ncbi:unnamed protein product [Bursaphelenchus okinawaensis]|uniref:SH3 domain-containing protein n=1 Tax=Bursaphelenchus okinawaensis TaxID=465554 RepID=A0A811KH93_9BILA|nr:unnamed protein product [Bursaphelenchus okinawaensis]CAG9103285.1 unnamed protein product [Bursaphelenchus okinawaensis]
MENPEALLHHTITQELPNDITLLSRGTENLEKAASYCEYVYVAPDRNQTAVLEETKRISIQSLASVATNVNAISNNLWKAMAIESDKMTSRQSNLKNLKTIINITREKAARREIGRLAEHRTSEPTNKRIAPPTIEKASRYQRTAIDFTILDDVGHGVVVPDQARMGGTVNRTHSIISGDSVAYGTTHLNSSGGIYEQWMPSQIPHGMYSQDTLRPSKDQYGTYACSTLKRHQPQHSVGGYNNNNQIYMSSTLNSRALPSVYNSRSTITADSNGDDDRLPSPPTVLSNVPATYIAKARALYDYTAARPDELNLTADAIIYIVRKNDDGWNEGVLDGVTGLYPDNYAEEIL